MESAQTRRPRYRPLVWRHPRRGARGQCINTPMRALIRRWAITLFASPIA